MNIDEEKFEIQERSQWPQLKTVQQVSQSTETTGERSRRSTFTAEELHTARRYKEFISAWNRGSKGWARSSLVAHKWQWRGSSSAPSFAAGIYSGQLLIYNWVSSIMSTWHGHCRAQSANACIVIRKYNMLQDG